MAALSLLSRSALSFLKAYTIILPCHHATTIIQQQGPLPRDKVVMMDSAEMGEREGREQQLAFMQISAPTQERSNVK